MRSGALVVSLSVAWACAPKSAPVEAPRPAPSSSVATAVGAHAPDAELTATSGAKVALAELLHQHDRTVVVFYRGFW